MRSGPIFRSILDLRNVNYLGHRSLLAVAPESLSPEALFP